jgi:pimeloyl-ACP methyl ester carboxylesterase
MKWFRPSKRGCWISQTFELVITGSAIILQKGYLIIGFVSKDASKPSMYKRSRAVFLLFLIAFTAVAYGQNPAPTPSPASSPSIDLSATKGKPPLIIIPGLTGSELINSRTGETVWFKATRAKDDDLRLPISPILSRNRDNLVAGDIIRGVRFFKFLPETEIYERLIEALKTRGGYKEGSWKNPPKDGYQDTFYVFPYDWRRDNVENARLLIQQVEQLKRTLRKPNLKFNIAAHSMGGLIARYAAMYGSADVPTSDPKPTWAGAKHFDKIFLMGTPNEGSISALNALLNGFSYVGGGLNLPFIQNISRFDVFTLPSIFELLPHDGSVAAYDQDLKPLNLDIYDPATWEKYQWTVWQDKDFDKKLSSTEQRNAKAYFNAVLLRAKRFQAALDANTSEKIPVSIYLMGADCKETQNGFVVTLDPKKNEYKTIFKAGEAAKTSGDKSRDEEMKKILYSNGDGVVTKRSLAGETLIATGKKNVFPYVSDLYQCEDHNRLISNPGIQDKVLQVLAGSLK